MLAVPSVGESHISDIIERKKADSVPIKLAVVFVTRTSSELFWYVALQYSLRSSAVAVISHATRKHRVPIDPFLLVTILQNMT